jgi:DNA-directed RNA polymerase specialized sigma24 family protein
LCGQVERVNGETLTVAGSSGSVQVPASAAWLEPTKHNFIDLLEHLSGHRPTAPAARGRHYWRNPPVALDAGQWERLPDRLGIDPARYAESAGIVAEVRRVVDDELTAHQRRVFVAIVVDGIPLDALAAKLGLQRNALYKVIFDARRKIRRALVANGHLEEPGLEPR